MLPAACWFSVLLVGSLALVMMSWGAHCLTSREPEKNLRAAVPSPKLIIDGNDSTAPEEPAVLKLTAVEATPSEEAREPLPLPPPAPAPLKIDLPPAPPKIELPPPLEPTPVVVPPVPETIPPPVIAVEATVPIIPEQHPPFLAINVHLGDTPMIRNWKMVAFYSVFVSAFAQAPALAGEKDKLDDVLKQLKALNTKADEIKDDIKGLKTDVGKLQGDYTSLRKDVGGNKMRIEDLEKDVKDLKIKIGYLTGAAPGGLTKVAWDELKTRLGNIEQAIAKLQPTETRTTKFMSPPNSTVGRVILVNLYGERLLFTVNNKEYVVEPNQTIPIEGVAAGALTYQVRSPVWGLRANAVTTLAANEVFTLYAR